MQDNDTGIIEEVVEAAEAAEAAEQQVKPVKAKVTFDAAQQEKVTELIKKAKSEAARALREEHAALKRDFEVLQRKQAPAAGEDVALQLAESRAELQALRRERQEASVTEALRTAASGQFVDDALAVQLLRNSVRANADGTVSVIDETGAQRLNGVFEAMSLAELVRELADSKPFLARGTVRGGSGSTPRQNEPQTLKLEEYFGAKATRSGELHKLARLDPARYRSLRNAAVAKGLVR